MKKQTAIYVLLLAAGFTTGMFFGKIKTQSESASKQKNISDAKISPAENHEFRSGGYQFINPLLECGDSDNYSQGQMIQLRQIIAKRVEEQKASDEVDEIAVYFRDLNNGPWLGINENAKFAPASLMKVPVMIAYYKLAETDPQILEKIISVEKISPAPYSQFYQPSKRIETSKNYSIEELIHLMMAYSDNDALTILLQNIDQQFLLKSYTDLGMIIPGAKSLDDELSVKEYSSFFRVLYNASYLEKEYSERALRMLIDSDFKRGILAGISENIQVAHKFGERYFMKNGSVENASGKQLHDCGIVYRPQKPYLLCIMSKGNDFEKLTKAIADISRIVFDNLRE